MNASVNITASRPFDVTLSVDDSTKVWLTVLALLAAGVVVYLKK